MQTYLSFLFFPQRFYYVFGVSEKKNARFQEYVNATATRPLVVCFIFTRTLNSIQKLDEFLFFSMSM